MSSSQDHLQHRLSYLKDAMERVNSSIESERYDDTYTASYDTSQYLPDDTLDKSFYGEISTKPTPRDIESMLEYEKIKSKQLELKISKKDELLHEMASLQTELYTAMEELENELHGYKQEAFSYKDKLQKCQGQSDKLMLGVKDRDAIICRLEEDYQRLKNREIQFNTEVDMIKRTVDNIEIQRSEDYQLIQDLKRKLQIVDKQNGQLTADQVSLQKEAASYRETAERQHLEITKLQQEITDLMKKNDILKFKETELNTYRQTIPARVRDLEKHIEFLNQDKENLITQLSSRRSLSNITGKTSESSTSYLTTASTHESPNPTSYKQLCQDLATYLNLDTPSKLFQTVLKLHKDSESSFKYRILADRLVDLICEMTGDEMYRSASPRDIWSWMSSRMEEYIDMKSKLSVNKCL